MKIMNGVRIVKAVQTCSACPSQWDAWDDQGNYWYLRYRWGEGTAQILSGPDADISSDPELSFSYGDSLDGSISLHEFCYRAGIELVSGDTS
jgi:hypothetical protein